MARVDTPSVPAYALSLAHLLENGQGKRPQDKISLEVPGLGEARGGSREMVSHVA